MFKIKSLKIKLLLLFLLLSIVVGGLIGGIIYSQFLDYINSSLKDVLDNAADFIISTLPYDSFESYKKAVEAKEPAAINYREIMGKYASHTGLAFLYMVTQEGDIVPTVEISNFMADQDVIIWENPAKEALQALSENKLYYSKPYTDEFGTFISLYKPLKTRDNIPVVIGVDYEISYVNSVRQIAFYSFLISFIIGLIVSFIAGWFIANRITNPIVSFDRELKKLAESDADLTISINSHSDDEIGQFAHSFNQFVIKLRDLITEINRTINGTDAVKINIISSTEETSAAIEEISSNLKSMGNQIVQLDNNVSENVTVIEEVTQNIGNMDQQIINQSAMVEESTAAVTEMIASLQSVNNVAQEKRRTTHALSDVASEGKAKIEDTAKAFLGVVQHIDQIKEMAGAINRIASQTNLLSMNAAIEAAHAGDSGRGFAVVAEEIRNLADSAGKSSQTISKMIKDITSSVKETEKKVDTASAAFDKITKEVQDTVNAFSEIEHSVSELNVGGQQILEATHKNSEITLSIKEGSNEIKTGTQIMLESSNQIKEISNQVNLGMKESISGATEIVNSIQMMVTLAQELSQIVEVLKKNFGQFKIN